MFDTLRQMLRHFWHEFLFSYHAHKKGGRDGERALRREADLRKKLEEVRQDAADERLAERWARAKTPEERQAAVDEIIKQVLEK